MKRYKISTIVKTLCNGAEDHAPGLLTGIGIAGSVTAMVLTIRATIQAGKALKEEKDKRERDYFNENVLQKSKEESNVNGSGRYPLNTTFPDMFEPIDVVKIGWKYYIPALLTEGTSLACIFASNHINTKRGAALAAAYTLSENAFKDYRDQVTEEVGEKKEKGIREKIAQKKVDESGIQDQGNLVIVDGKNTLCRDELSGRPFYSDIHDIRKAVDMLNVKLRNEMYVSLNEFYDELNNKNLPHIPIGDQVGWNIEDGSIEVELYSTITNDERACIVVGYNVSPKYDYMKRY